jgi:hypothetical protein
MRCSPFVLLFYFFLVPVLFSCVSYASPKSRVISSDYLGIITHGGKGPDEKEQALLDELGAVWIRETFYWSSIERRQGEFDFSVYDEWLDVQKEGGRKILAILAYDVAWIHQGNKRRRFVNAEQLPLYLRYVEETVMRYRGRVDAWEIWNEPNWIFWKGSREDFYALTKMAIAKIRELDPQATIVAGSFNRVSKKFIREMFKAGAFEGADVISFHPYDLGPDGAVRLYDQFESFLAGQGYKGRIWVTEVGYPTGGLYPTRIRESRQPDYVVKTLAGLAVRGAEISFWYELYDSRNRNERRSPFDSESFFGIAYPGQSRKKGFAAFALCGRFIAGSEYRPGLPRREGLPASVETLCFSGQDGRQTLLVWNRGAGTIKVRLALPGSRHELYDITTGKGRPLEANAALRIGSRPQFITWTAPSLEDGDESGIVPKIAGGIK